MITILAPRAKTEPTAPDGQARVYSTNSGRSQAIRGAAETTALVTFAYAAGSAPGLRARRSHRLAAGASRRQWLATPSRPGAGIAALGSYFGRAESAEDRYKLTVTVNDTQVALLNVIGSAPGQTIAVPRKAIKVGQPNRVHFAMEGRGRFGYAITLAGFTRDLKPDQNPANRLATINRRVYLPSAPSLMGRRSRLGFGVTLNATYFENLATQVALGGRVRVSLTAWREYPRHHARMGA